MAHAAAGPEGPGRPDREDEICAYEASRGGAHERRVRRPGPHRVRQQAGELRRQRQRGSSGSGTPFSACMVLDTGGVDDHSFNESSYAGMKAAQKENPNIKISYVAVELAERLHAEPQRGRAEGLRLDRRRRRSDGRRRQGGRHRQPEAAVRRGRRRRPAARTSTASSSTPPRARSSAATSPPAMSKTGKVATFGGLNIPPVTIYMDGFWEGVQYYNQQKGKNVKVLGWDENEPEGRHVRAVVHRPEPGQADQPDVHPAGRRHHLPGRRRHRAGRRRGRAGLRRQGQRHLGRHRRLRVGRAVLQVFLTSVTKNLSDSVKEYVTKAAGGTFPTGSLRRHAGQQRHRAGAVPRLRLEGPRGREERARPGQGRHHQRQDQDHLAVPADQLRRPRRGLLAPGWAGGTLSVLARPPRPASEGPHRATRTAGHHQALRCADRQRLRRPASSSRARSTRCSARTAPASRR